MADEWIRERIELATQEGSLFKFAQAETLKGLAVHRTPGDLTTWNVTHVSSGKSLVNTLANLESARSCLYDLLDLGADWTLDEEAIKAYGLTCGLGDAVATIKQCWKDVP